MPQKTREEMQLDIVNRNLLEAVSYNDMDKITLCLKKGADINTRNTSQQDRTPLMMAVLSGREPLVKFIIAQGGDLLAQDRAGKTVYELVHDLNDWNAQERINRLLLNALPDMPAPGQQPAVSAQLAETKDDITVMKPLDVSKGKNAQPGGKGFSL
jgi:ankyrin repeat protein